MADTDEELFHYGILRRSGRYPWGSGGTPHQRSTDFLAYVKEMQRLGLSDPVIAKGVGLTTTQLRATRSIAVNEKRAADTAHVQRLHDKGMSNVAIGKQLGINESSVRSYLNPARLAKQDVLMNTASMLKAKVDEGGYLDIGLGTENHLKIPANKLTTSVEILKEQGYKVINVQVPQQGMRAGQKTTVKVLAPPGTTYKDVVQNTDKIKSVAAWSTDGGHTYDHIEPPVNIKSSRVHVRYAEDGGGSADGVIYVRRGVQDLSLGKSNYAQVRVAVDGTHFIKGMAMYKDDMPEGADLVFNTSKKKADTPNKLDALKPQKEEANPFGTFVRQFDYTGADGKMHRSAMNLVNEEGDWGNWRKSLSSQVLSKQKPELAKRQLDHALRDKSIELEQIMAITNPVVKRKLLDTFADSADSASVHLKAAALPRQGSHVILPIPSLKEHEIYAPNYNPGEVVALIRHPHGGTFEIPELRVNNKNREARATLGTHPPDAVGIHPNTAKLLSGADFDGDTVLVIPNNRHEITTSPALKSLKNFDPISAYPKYPGMKEMTGKMKQQQMGDISNLITDMTIRGATDPEEFARAVRHSMVVIDAEKHTLNYKQSYKDNGIAALKEKYQGKGDTGRLKGASTLISRSSSDIRVDARKLRRASEGGSIDPITGNKVFVKTGQTYPKVNVSKRTGARTTETVVKKMRSTRMAETRDARTLSSGTRIEEIYATHANSLKALAREARLASLHTGSLKHSPSATKTYGTQVARLNAALNTALKNAPLERQAQLLAKSMIAARIQDNPGLDDDQKKKLRGQSLNIARARVGAGKDKIVIEPDEWVAIQAGAISTNRLSKILENADLDHVKALATPRAATVMSPQRMAIARARLASGYSQVDVARSLGIPVTTLNTALQREEGG